MSDTVIGIGTKQKQQVLFEDVQKKFTDTISTTDELKTAIWAPVSKVSPNSVIYKEFISNGRKRIVNSGFNDIEQVIISGQILTQSHKDIVDGILTSNKKLEKTEEGDYIALISVYEVLKLISNSANNHDWLNEKIGEIKEAVVTFVPKSGNKKSYVSFNIFNTIYYDEDRKMYAVVLSKEFLRFFVGRLTMDYRKHIPHISKLKGEGNGFIKAAIRFFISQNMKDRDGPYVIKLSTLLDKLDQPRSTPRQTTAAHTYVNRFVNDLAKYCIEYDKKARTFFYHGADHLYFTQSLFENKKVK